MTSRVLDESGIVHAGSGENLAQAGAARFLEAARGRVGWCHLLQRSRQCLVRAIPLARRQADLDSTPLRLAESIVVPPGCSKT